MHKCKVTIHAIAPLYNLELKQANGITHEHT